MGNNKSIPVAEKAQKEEVNIASTCTICFDECVEALRCDRGHSLCSTCVAPYIQSIVEDAGKLKDRQYMIKCPVENCKSAPYCPAELYQYCNPKSSMNQYVSALVEICNHSNSGVYQATEPKSLVVPRLLEALNLHCPNPTCNSVLDPTPDGCAAVRCAACATYTCFLCFTACKDSISCHKHVRECPYSSSPGNLFISEALRQSAHKRVRVMQLREVLARELISTYLTASSAPHTVAGSLASNKLGEQLARLPASKHHLRALGNNLKDLTIVLEDVFKLDVTPKSPVAQTQAQGQGNRYVGGRAAGQGPLLQPAAGRHVHCWEALAVLVMVLLFLCVMVYVVFLLASVANRRKEEGGGEGCVDSVDSIDAGGLQYHAARADEWGTGGVLDDIKHHAEGIALSSLDYDDAEVTGLDVGAVLRGMLYVCFVAGVTMLCTCATG